MSGTEFYARKVLLGVPDGPRYHAATMGETR